MAPSRLVRRSPKGEGGRTGHGQECQQPMVRERPALILRPPHPSRRSAFAELLRMRWIEGRRAPHHEGRNNGLMHQLAHWAVKPPMAIRPDAGRGASMDAAFDAVAEAVRFGCPAGIWDLRPRRVVTSRDGAESSAAGLDRASWAGAAARRPIGATGPTGGRPGTAATCAMAVPAQAQEHQDDCGKTTHGAPRGIAPLPICGNAHAARLGRACCGFRPFAHFVGSVHPCRWIIPAAATRPTLS